MNLPTPPALDEVYLFEETDKYGLYSWAIFSLGVLLLGMLLLVHAHVYFWPYALIAGVVMSYLLLSYFIGLFGESNTPLVFKPLTQRPGVDVVLHHLRRIATGLRERAHLHHAACSARL